MNVISHFKNREDAGKQLAEKLQQYKNTNAVILALPRGGVVAARKIAQQLHIPLDLVITRKIGHPLLPEYAIGAIGESGYVVMNKQEAEGIDKHWLEEEIKKEQKEIKRRKSVYLQNKTRVDIKGKAVIIVDDGIATGLTMKAAIQEIKGKSPKKLIIAVPVAPADTAEELKKYCDECIVLYIDPLFKGSVGSYYGEFDQVSDEKIVEIINKRV